MGEKDIRSISLFFFFAFLNEAKAVEASARAVAYARERKKRRPQEEAGTTVVLATKEIWERIEAEDELPPPPTGNSAWVLPAGVDLRSWREFLKIASTEELGAVIWSAILGLPDQVIAEALDVTPGTVRYRWGHGLGKLGRLVGPRASVVR